LSRGYLLDSHTFLWGSREPEKLSRKARRICESPTKPLFVSAVSFWELIAKETLAGAVRLAHKTP
jgi:PIN domain nuclease of toxin-antitoxin system